jgi:hypothetical protein
MLHEACVSIVHNLFLFDDAGYSVNRFDPSVIVLWLEYVAKICPSMIAVEYIKQKCKLVNDGGGREKGGKEVQTLSPKKN